MKTMITVVGNLTRDPRTATSRSGDTGCFFTVAASERRLNQATGQWEDVSTLYYDCALWGRTAEAAARILAKGAKVIVHGKLELKESEYQGQKRRDLGIQVSEVGVCPKPSPSASSASSGGYAPTAPISAAPDPLYGEAPF